MSHDEAQSLSQLQDLRASFGIGYGAYDIINETTVVDSTGFTMLVLLIIPDLFP